VFNMVHASGIYDFILFYLCKYQKTYFIIHIEVLKMFPDD